MCTVSIKPAYFKMNLHLNETQLVFMSTKVVKIKYRLCVWARGNSSERQFISALFPLELQCHVEFAVHPTFSVKTPLPWRNSAWHFQSRPGLRLVFCRYGFILCDRLSWVQPEAHSPQAGGSGDPPALQCPERFPLAFLAPHLNHPSSRSASAPGKEVDTDLKYRGITPVISPWDMRTVQPCANEIPWPSSSC